VPIKGLSHIGLRHGTARTRGCVNVVLFDARRLAAIALLEISQRCHSDVSIDFLAAAVYPDAPNFCRRRKSAGKNYGRRKRRRICKIWRAAAKTLANLRLSLKYTKHRIIYFAC